MTGRATSVLFVLVAAVLVGTASGIQGGVRRRAELAVQQAKIRHAVSELTPFLKPGESPYRMESSSIHELLNKVEARIHVEAENINSRFQSLANKALLKKKALYAAAELSTAKLKVNQTRAEAKLELLESKLEAAQEEFDMTKRAYDKAKGKMIVAQEEEARLNKDSAETVKTVAKTKIADLKVTLKGLKKQLNIIRGIRKMLKIFLSGTKSQFNPVELKDVAGSVVDAEFNATVLNEVPGLDFFDTSQ